MIVAIIDIVASREISDSKRKKMDKEIRSILSETHSRFKKHCIATPALTQGDSIELLISDWLPVIFLLHSLLLKNLDLRVGLGTGKIIVQHEKADECDGPVFWNARQALDEIKQAKYMTSNAGFKFDKKTSSKENNAVINTILFFTTLQSLSSTQLRYCYHYIWEEMQISEIAKAVNTSKGNISKTLNKTPCYLLEKVVAILNRSDK
jgi:predicted DNA-binding ArsR family transcriptional regulator